MVRKKGFTFIELLAVITILAVISIMSAIIVNKYVVDAKKNALKETLKNVEKASSMYFYNNNIKNVTIIDLTKKVIKLNQNLIEKGQVFGNRNFSKIYLYQKGYCGYIENDNIVVEKMDILECDWDVFNTTRFINNRNILKDEKILSYRIYGNTNNEINLGDDGEIILKLSGKNILDKKQFTQEALRNETGISIWAVPILNNNWVKENLMPSTTYTVSFDSICLNVPEYNEKYSSNNGFYLYTSTMPRESVFLNEQNKYYNLNESYKSATTITTSQYLHDNSADFKILGYTNRYLNNNIAALSTILYKNVQIEEGSVATRYEPYLEPIEYKIIIKEPLRKLDDAVDYIDSSISHVVRNVGVNVDGSLYKLSEPTYEYIKLPEINNMNGTTVIRSYDENINSSKIEILLGD